MIGPQITLLKRQVSTFKLFGYSGFLTAITLCTMLTLNVGLSLLVLTVLIFSSALTFFALAFLTKVIKGEETLIYYHHEIAIVVIAAIILLITREPVWNYLDIVITGIGIFLSFGRIGCLTAGCCYGKPTLFGVSYNHAHVKLGFPGFYKGVALLPIQAIESVWVLIITLCCIFFQLHKYSPGMSFAWYVIMYDAGRFCFEFLRGDHDRPYHAGFSEAQWISVFLTWLIVLFERIKLLPYQSWHVFVATGITTVMLLTGVYNKIYIKGLAVFLMPLHLKEVGEFVSAIPYSFECTNPLSSITSLGLIISYSNAKENNQVVHYFGISAKKDIVLKSMVKRLAFFIEKLKKKDIRLSDIRKSNNGIYLVTFVNC